MTVSVQTADPIADVLKLASARSVVTGGFSAGGPWALSFPPLDRLKFFAVVRGQLRLTLVQDETSPRVPDVTSVLVEEGDVFLVWGRAFILSSDPPPGIPPLDAVSVFAATTDNQVRLGDGGDSRVIGGHVDLDPAHQDLVAGVFSPLFIARGSSSQGAAMRWLLEQLVAENESRLPGASVAAVQLAQLLFVQILRSRMASIVDAPAGWLRALGDPQISAALTLMHADPGHDWGLEELAKATSMSRATFASRFKTVAGTTPLAYLSEWRMRLAAKALRDEDVSISELALSLGYASDSAFSNAFKRQMKLAPKHYRERSREAHA